MSTWRIVLAVVVVSCLTMACGGQKPPSEPVAVKTEAVETPQEVVGEEEVVVEVVPEAAPEPVAEAPEKGDAGEAAVEGGVPKLVVPEPIHDFGQRDNTETVTNKFVLRNEGTGILEITNVHAGCGCTTTDLPTNKLAPGEQVELAAHLSLKGRQGPQQKAVTVTTNDPVQPTVRLTLKADALASISAEPLNLAFGRIMDDEPRDMTVTVKSNKEDITFTIVSAEISGMDFLEHEVKEIETERVYEVVVRTKEAPPVGNLNGRLLIQTDSEERRVIMMPINMQVIGPLQITPPVVNIRFSEDPEELEEQVLSITPGRIEEFVIEEVIVPLDSIAHELKPISGMNYHLRLGNMPRTDALEGKSVILRTNVPNHPEIEIPFNIYRPILRPSPTASTVRVTPRSITIRESEDAIEYEQQTLTIAASRVTEQDSFKVEEVTVPLESIEYTLTQINDATWRVVLSNIPRTAELRGKEVVIRTNLPDSGEVKVPINVYNPRTIRPPAAGAAGPVIRRPAQITTEQ